MIVEESVYRNAEADMVKNAFNQGSYLGIRSLPNALKPDFRQQLYERILLDAKQKASVPTPSKGVSMPSAASQAHAAGQKKPLTEAEKYAFQCRYSLESARRCKPFSHKHSQ